MTLYIDDSGSRHPDRNPGDTLPKHGYDWFGLGGVMVRDDEEAAVRQEHAALCNEWGLDAPLHSTEIRNRSGHFAWLGQLPTAKRDAFLEALARLVTGPQLTAIACVVDRPGYNHRYRDIYGRKRWSLCKTAFTVVVERAAKYAMNHDCRLRVYVERSDKRTDNRMRSYYDTLRNDGHPFNPNNAAKYQPLTGVQLHTTLYEFRTKDKSSPLMQLADICLWPMCMGGYDPTNRPYRTLKEAGTLIDCKLDPAVVEFEGIKYSCWDLNTESK